MPKNNNCIAIYSRKSKFTGKGESIGNQVELCKEYIFMHYGEEAIKNCIIYEDEGFSGGNLNRPDFKKMMKAAKERKFQAIVVYRLDRISRNISDFSNLIEELSRLDIAFVSIKEQFDTATPMGRAMMYISSVFSQLERETIAERIRDNMHELAKTGRWLGGVTPTGYSSESVKNITVDGKNKKSCKLKLIPEEAEIIKMIYELFLEIGSLTKTEWELMQRNILTKNGKNFTRFALKGILQNPVYVIADQDIYHYFKEKDVELFADKEEFDNKHGILAYNRTAQEKGKSTVFLPMKEWIVSVGQHPGIISGKMWIQVQNYLERNKSKAYQTPRRNEALLTGILYCSCGSRMYPKLTRRKTSEGKEVYTYLCKNKEYSKRTLCNSKNINGNILDQAVIEQLKLLEDDKGEFVKQLEQSKNLYTKNLDQYEERLNAFKKEREEKEAKIDALVDSLGVLGAGNAKKRVGERIERLNQECERIEVRIQELESLTSQESFNAAEFDILRQLLCVFKNSVDDMTVEQKRYAIRTVVRKVVWDGENAHIILFGASEKDSDIEYPDMTDILSKKNPYLSCEVAEKEKSFKKEQKSTELVNKLNGMNLKTPSSIDSK